MGKKSSSKPDKKFAESLGRRPIHKEVNKSPDSGREYEDKPVPSQTSKLYPDLSADTPTEEKDDDDEYDQNSKTSQHDYNCERSLDSDVKDKKSPDLVKKFLILIIFIVVSYVVYFSCFPQSQEIKKSSIVDVDHLLKNMKNQFPNQHIMTFKIIKAALRKVYNITQEPTAPAVILLLVDIGAEDTGVQFSKSLAKQIAGENFLYIKDDMYLQEPDSVKMAIDEKIQSKVKTTMPNAILIDKLEKMPIHAAMLFHNYCDEETARFKYVTYLFILSINTVLPQNSEVHVIDKVATEQLENIWKNSGSDYYDSLVNRLTRNVVNIKKT